MEAAHALAKLIRDKARTLEREAHSLRRLAAQLVDETAGDPTDTSQEDTEHDEARRRTTHTVSV